MKKYFVNISGGGIKFIGLLSAFTKLKMAGVSPSILSGVSAGGIVAFLAYSNKLLTGLEVARQSWNPKVIFSKKNKPTGIIGGVSVMALYRILKKRNYLGKMDNLEKNLRSIVTKEYWDELQQKPENIDCYIHCIDEKTHKKGSFNLRYLSYDQAIDVVIGSASISPVVPPRKTTIEGIAYQLVDGGHRDPSAGSYLLASGTVNPKDFDECITIWSRNNPKDHSVTEDKNTGNILDRLFNTTIGMPMREASINDEQLEKSACKAFGKKHSSIYVDIKSKGTYSISKSQVKDAEIIADQAVKDYITNA